MIPHIVELDPSTAGRLPEQEYTRLLGYPPGRLLKGDATIFGQEARSWCDKNARPWARARTLEVLELRDHEVAWRSPDVGLSGVFHSTDLANRLTHARAHALIAVAVSAGAEVDAKVHRLHKSGAFVDASFLDRYAAALAEWVAAEVGRSLAEAVQPDRGTVLTSRSPGREDWDLRDQAQLFASLGIESADVEMTDGGMLRPVNSLLTTFGITRDKLTLGQLGTIPCETCTWSPCRFRRINRD